VVPECLDCPNIASKFGALARIEPVPAGSWTMYFSGAVVAPGFNKKMKHFSDNGVNVGWPSDNRPQWGWRTQLILPVSDCDTNASVRADA
jgi:hypothetical protein